MHVTASSHRVTAASVLALVLSAIGTSARAADVIKADNADALNLTTSWTGGVVPTAVDVGVWDSTVTGANTVGLGGNLSWQGIRIADPGGAVSITAGSTLTLGASGIDMSSATADLSIASGVTLGTGQSWTVDTGRTLTVTGAISETGGVQGLTKAGDGALTLTGGNTYTGTTTVSAGTLSLGNGTTSGSLPDPSGISIASGAEFHWNRPSNDTTFANSLTGSGTFAKTGGELGLTGTNNFSGTIEVRSGKLGAEGSSSLGGNPALVVTAGTLSLGGGYSGATATVSSLSGAGRIDGVFGAGATRTLRVDQAADTEFSGTFGGISGTRVVALEKGGVGTLTLSGGANAYSAANVTVDGGTLEIGAAENSTTIFSSAARTVTVNSGATLAFVYRNAFGAVGSTPSTVLVVDGGTVVSSNDALGAVNVLRNLSLNSGATLEATKNNAGYQTYQLTGTVTVGGTSASAITSGLGGGGITVGNGSDDFGTTTFDVADVTASAAADLTISAGIANSGNNGDQIGGLIKTGAGTLVLSAGNSYTGSTTISAGSLVLGAGGTTGSLNDASAIDIAVGATLHWNRSNSDTGFGNAISGAGTFLKSGAGEIGLTGTNTFSGLIDIQAGKIGLPSSGSVDGSPRLNVASGGTLSLGTGFSNGTATIGSLSGAGSVDTAFGGSNDIRTLSVSQSNDGTFSGTLADATGGRLLALTKNGSATLTLSGTNTYTGATTVDAGTLRVEGSLAAGSAVTVQAAGTLGGSGTIGGATTIFGTHSPGASPGVQTFGSDLGYDGATVIWELTSNTSTQTDPAVFDQVIVGNNLDFTSATSLSLVFNDAASSVDWNDAFWNTDQEWLLYDVAGTTTNLGNLSISTASWVDGFGNVFATVRPDASFSVRQATGSGDVLLSYVAVPEPGTLALAACGLALAGWHLARRRND